MKRLIREILKEEVTNSKDKFHKDIINLLNREGFTGLSDYNKIINFINHHLGIKGMEAFELYQVFKDNWRKPDEDELVRTDITKRKLRTSNTRGRNLVINKIPFKGSNTHGEYMNGSYVVFSYNWYPIFVFKDGQWFENEDTYSVSTAKQMNQLRPYDQGIIETSKDKLWDIINSR
jgi:hypothetical protein